MSDKEIYEYVSESDLVKFTGEPGKALFLNPCKCWHYGARTKSKDRLSLIISYAPLNEPIEGMTCFGLKKYSSWLGENDLSISEKHLLGIFEVLVNESVIFKASLIIIFSNVFEYNVLKY